MNDEAAESRGPSTPGAGPQGAAAPSAEKEGAAPPYGAGANVPPWLTNASAAFTRQQLVRPREGRYIAGVCGALARATNTDPVLWRVLIGVLGILGGTGVLIYLIGWLVIPSEGDTASPIESLLGKGQSGMTPLSVVLLGGAALLTFAFIVGSGARASMLAAAVLIGAFLLIKRGNVAGGAPPPPHVPPAAPHTAPHPEAPATAPAAPVEEPTLAFTAPPAGPVAPPAADPVTPPAPPRYEPPRFTFAPPGEGVRPPFAPHGPYATAPVAPSAPATPKPPKPPKPPKERSILGRLTFFAVVMVMGLLTVLDMAGLSVTVSAYFAAALATVALGLIVGTWFGRARGLIALALVATLGLFAATGAEDWGGEFRDSVYRPANLTELADQYDFTFGNVTLDLRDVDFTGAEQSTAVTMNVGQLRVLLPPQVDTTVDVSGGGVRTVLFGQESSSAESPGKTVTDLGTDGTGGGSLQLDLRLDTGNLEVTR